MKVAAICSGLVLTLAATNCKTRHMMEGEGGGSDANAVDLGSLRTDGLARIDWACAGKGKRNNTGANSQEEYCEWTRKPVAFRGQVFSNSTGSIVSSDLPQACVFTTSFDQTRSFFLTQRVVGNPNKFNNKQDPFWATQFNSYAFLVGGREPDNGVPRDGIIGHCITGKKCSGPNCVADRASDPQICQTLNTLAGRQCKVDINYQVAPVVTAGAVPSGRMGDQIVKPQLKIARELESTCSFATDPKLASGRVDPNQERTLVVCDARGITNCDSLADRINVVVELKLQNTSCVGGSQGSAPAAGSVQLGQGNFCKVLKPEGSNARSTPSSATDDNIRINIKQGTEVFIRGFIGDWASVEFSSDGQEFGKTDQSRTFIAKSQFLDGNRSSQCRRP